MAAPVVVLIVSILPPTSSAPYRVPPIVTRDPISAEPPKAPISEAEPLIRFSEYRLAPSPKYRVLELVEISRHAPKPSPVDPRSVVLPFEGLIENRSRVDPPEA